MSLEFCFNAIYLMYYKCDNDEVYLVIKNHEKVIRSMVNSNVNNFLCKLLGRIITDDDVNFFYVEITKYMRIRNNYFTYLKKVGIIDGLLSLTSNVDIKSDIDLLKRFRWIDSPDKVRLIDFITIEMIPQWRNLLSKIDVDDLPPRMLHHVHSEVSLLVTTDKNNSGYYRVKRNEKLKRFTAILSNLDLPIQERICNIVYGINKKYFPVHKRELSFVKKFIK